MKTMIIIGSALAGVVLGAALGVAATVMCHCKKHGKKLSSCDMYGMPDSVKDMVSKVVSCECGLEN